MPRSAIGTPCVILAWWKHLEFHVMYEAMPRARQYAYAMLLSAPNVVRYATLIGSSICTDLRYQMAVWRGKSNSQRAVNLFLPPRAVLKGVKAAKLFSSHVIACAESVFCLVSFYHAVRFLSKDSTALR